MTEFPPPQMSVSIGILAHNEEKQIGATIGSLLAQSLVADSAVAKEIVVVANGCSDGTVDVARTALAVVDADWNCRTKIVDLAEAGKANAWNAFIHEASDRSAEFIVLMDADIEFCGADVLADLLGHLSGNPHLAVAADQPVKKFSGRGPLSPAIRALQKTGSDSGSALSGQLYAARASDLRSIAIPRGVVVEDGFLRAVILTRNFTAKEDPSRISKAPGARHFYAPYETLSDIYRYERRQAVGSAVNRLLFEVISAWSAEGLDASTEIKRRNTDEPEWVEALVSEKAASGGILAIPARYVFRRLRRKENWSFKRVLKLPLVFAATAFDVAVAIGASRQMRDQSKRAHWETIRR